MKFHLNSLINLIGIVAISTASAQTATTPTPAATPAPATEASAPKVSPTINPVLPPGELAPVEKLAEEAQRQLFNAADNAGGGASSAQGQSLPSPITTGSGGRKVFSAMPAGSDPSKWEKGSYHKIAVMEVEMSGDRYTVMFELFPQDAPRTVSNFLDNIESGSYKGLAFHRAIPNFIVQTGDPLTSDDGTRDNWGTGGNNKTVPAEIKRPHRRGAVAMGRKGDAVNPSRASNGYQFYFALGNYESLDSKYTVFGQVISGMDVLEKISRSPVDSNDSPLARIEIKSIKAIDHTGPLATTVADNSSNSSRKVTKPRSAKGFFERVLERVW